MRRTPGRNAARGNVYYRLMPVAAVTGVVGSVPARFNVTATAKLRGFQGISIVSLPEFLKRIKVRIV